MIPPPLHHLSLLFSSLCSSIKHFLPSTDCFTSSLFMPSSFFPLFLHTLPTSPTPCLTPELAHFKVPLCEAGSRHLQRHCIASILQQSIMESHVYAFARRDVVTLPTTCFSCVSNCLYTFLGLLQIVIFLFCIEIITN